MIAVTRDGTILRYDAATGRRRAVCHVGKPGNGATVETMVISPRGESLAISGQHAPVYLFDLSDDGVSAVGSPTTPGNTNGQCLAFAPDGNSLAASGSGGTNAVLREIATGKTQSLMEGTVNSRALAFAPDGRTLAVVDDSGVLRLWDLATRFCEVAVRGHRGGIWCVAFAPDGRTLVTAGSDGTIRNWDVWRGRSCRRTFRGLTKDPSDLGFAAEAKSLAFLADDTQVLAANARGSVLACNLADGTTKALRTTDRPSSDAQLSPDGQAVAVLKAHRAGLAHERTVPISSDHS